MDQAEQLRIIKANNQIRPTARVITVTSGKGGVGKSNMSINLAIQFRKMGKRVIILYHTESGGAGCPDGYHYRGYRSGNL